MNSKPKSTENRIKIDQMPSIRFGLLVSIWVCPPLARWSGASTVSKELKPKNPDFFSQKNIESFGVQ